MGCTLRQSALPRGREIRVNGVPIPRAAISAEAQHHPARTPLQAWKQAAQALIVRELLLQEARRLGVCTEPASDAQGRRETGEEATIRALLEREVATPEPDEETCRRYYAQNPRRFRSPDIYEAAHILFAAHQDDAQAYARAKAMAEQCLAALREQPERFAELAAAHSACPSAAQGGNLGQITKGQTTPEFERALFALSPGETTQAPVATRYGFHIIRLDRRHEGRQLPYEFVAPRIADYLREAVRRRALAQYVARLAGGARIEGIDLPSAADLRVN
ncbi:MAG TPA: peptidylprolyl isomerase [Xanthobacteraceae bacterium]|nr:peptidylprolyl isomerase [Xanthobacteraceae bacterium]